MPPLPPGTPVHPTQHPTAAHAPRAGSGPQGSGEVSFDSFAGVINTIPERGIVSAMAKNSPSHASDSLGGGAADARTAVCRSQWRGHGDSSTGCQRLLNGHPGLRMGHPEGWAEQQPGHPRRAPRRSSDIRRWVPTRRRKMGACPEAGCTPGDKCGPQRGAHPMEDGCTLGESPHRWVQPLKMGAAPQDKRTPGDGYTLRHRCSPQSWAQPPKTGALQDLGTPLGDRDSP